MKEKSQKTRTGHEIPVPKRGDFLKDLKKATTPEKSAPDRRPEKKR